MVISYYALMNESPLTIVFFIVLLLVFVIYITARYWRANAKAKMADILKALRTHDIDLNRYQQHVAVFQEIEEKSPFEQQYQSIQKQLTQLNDNRQKEMARYLRLREEIDQFSVPGLKNRVLGPYYWFEILRKVNQLEQLSVTIDHQLALLGDQIQSLVRIRDRVTADVHTAWEQLEELHEVTQALIDHQLPGEEVGKLKRTHQAVHQRLTEIPAHLLALHQPRTMDIETLRDVTATYKILEETRPVLTKSLTESNHWLEQAQLLHAAIQQLTGSIKQAEDRLKRLPSNLDPADFLYEMQDARMTLNRAYQVSNQLEPNQLEKTLEATVAAYEKMKAIPDRCEAATAALNQYQQLRESVEGDWQQLNNTTDQLVNNPLLPLSFTTTDQILSSISDTRDSLAQLEGKHAPSRYSEELAIMQDLSADMAKLQQELTTLQHAQAELTILIRRLKTEQLTAWIDETKQQATALTKFAPENYDRPPDWQDMNLMTAIENIQQTAKEKLPDLDQTISEDDVLPLLTAAQEIEKVRDMIASGMQNQMDQLAGLEKQQEQIAQKAQQIHEEMQNLTALPADKQVKRQYKAMLHTSEDIMQKMESPHLHMIKDESARLTSLENKAKISIMQQIAAARKDKQALGSEVGNLVEELQTIAQLNDPILDEAREAIAENTDTSDFETADLPEQAAMYEQSVEANNLLQQYLNEIETMHHNVTKAHREYQQAQQQCDSVLEKMTNNIDTTSWDQNALNVERVSKESRLLDQSMVDFCNQPHQSQHLVTKLQQYTKRYQALNEKLADLTDAIHQDQQKIDQMENALRQTLEMWKRVAMDVANDFIASREIQSLLQDYNSRFARERRAYSNGESSLDAYLRILKQLDSDLNNETASTQNQRSLDINGQEII
jgi:chromosome segregation ATPase